MEYKNTKTGATFSSPCKISGGNWVLSSDYAKKNIEVTSADDKKVIIEDEQPEEAELINTAPDEITKKQIMQELDAFEVEYNPQAKKQELYDLMMQQGK
ncbi:hypothetical protein [Candidatus Enterococcus clewellii]|uniref:Phage protein n=1 Tax=Candidatus Enterococcus clewellii TaxID=1834193 RepID=A0A242K9R1_9ENTE|nr:hypothetical protein [Enterococcus sp. 9E7_DIV0242]OTP13713.1 hypothetical protein A5888_003192 [Enterococcus sp. 9E7_DIV0242]OTP17290.1 hypothetical protein A5888_001428 [Enterococcus sp. 9E7_DIV0242]